MNKEESKTKTMKMKYEKSKKKRMETKESLLSMYVTEYNELAETTQTRQRSNWTEVIAEVLIDIRDILNKLYEEKGK